MEQTYKEENSMEANFNISKFPLNATKFYKLDKSQDWVKKLLIELNEKAENKSPDEFLAETDICIHLEIEKKFKKEYREYLLLKANISTNYVTQCVRTLEDMNDSLELEIKICFLTIHLEKEESFTEQLEIFENNDMYELYFYKKGFADIGEMIHEQVYLNLNEYPIKDAEASLDWANGTSTTKQ